MTQRFAKQICIVTGGAQGIGLGIAQRLHNEGAHVVLFDVSTDTLSKSHASFSDRCTVHTVDVTSEESVKAGVQAVMQEHKQIDVIINAAGITGKTGIKTEQVDLSDFNRVMAINVNGIFLMCKYVIPHMRQRNYGRIVNIASISGKEGNAGMLAYSTSKAAVIGLTKVIGKELADNNESQSNVVCNCIAPAVVQTAMVDAMPAEQVKYMTDKIPMKRTGKIDEIASMVAWMSSTECSFSTGAVFDATGGRATY